MTKKSFAEYLLQKGYFPPEKSKRIAMGIAMGFTEELFSYFMQTLIAEKELIIPGLGKLHIKGRKARTGRNPQTGEKIKIAARNTVLFKAYKDLKEAVNGGAKKKTAKKVEKKVVKKVEKKVEKKAVNTTKKVEKKVDKKAKNGKKK